MPYSIIGFFEIKEDMVQILLMFEIFFQQDSKVEDLVCGAFLLNAAYSSVIISSAWGISLLKTLKFIKANFQHDFARMTDETDSSVVLADL